MNAGGASNTFLSEEWFASAFAHTQSTGMPRSHPRARLQFEVLSGTDRLRYGQVIADGKIQHWELGELDHADIEVRLDIAHAWQLFSGQMDGSNALEPLVVVDNGDGREGSPSPLDLAEQPELHELPRIPGATLDVRYDYRDGPWGDVSFHLGFVDGRVTQIGLGAVPKPDVVVRCSYLQMAQVRRGDIGILDVLANGGTVTGAEGALALLGGISESAEFRQAEMACGRSGLALGVLGLLHSSPTYRASWAGLLEITDPPVGLETQTR